ncbi:MAG: type III-A CRISPR-associated RAMP protein Csm3 [Phycisphaerae bacterium]|nr:MAG: type III-A CRISPR-associated RAMP protein Csm3 [Planctomycetia bacterium]RIK67950.1 MAG: type III-A CRISPR-associated RAMP protein Csm3 [Planctomycetota bacterium]GJQ27110.1 MAG: type III-A CRISPR-associated RAMP protein Csm3 [Phycisphaerae bacterium]
MKKVDHYVIRPEIELLSGTRIGGSDDILQIGGTDLTCIKDPVTGRPYIPGSSIKGKMRSSLEKALGKTTYGREPCGCADAKCPICRVFGPHKQTNHQLGPTRIILRDAPLISGEFAIENKTESTNRRDTGAAEHPRTVERVAPGAKFALEIGVQVFDIDAQFKYKNADGNELTGANALLEVVDHALWEMEQTGIGAGTSKGYGKVKIHWDGSVEKCKRTSRARNISAGPCITPGATS